MRLTFLENRDDRGRDFRALAVYGKTKPLPSRSRVVHPSPMTHPNRIVFPADRITKAEIAAHYARVAEKMSPHFDGRLVSLVRAPETIEETFFQSHPAIGMTPGIRTVGEGDHAGMSLVGAAGLRAAAQCGAVEIHGAMSRHDAPDNPDRLIFDLDPGLGVSFVALTAAAKEMADHLDAMGVASWPLLTGGKGVHVVAPLDRSLTSAAVETFARAFARDVERRRPELFVASTTGDTRAGRILVDWTRNKPNAIAVLPWSLRARAGAPVAVPLTWGALRKVESSAAYSLSTISVLRDPWERFFETTQTLPARAPARL
jgi:bifunctional non-homologous end joining protein LigD